MEVAGNSLWKMGPIYGNFMSLHHNRNADKLKLRLFLAFVKPFHYSLEYSSSGKGNFAKFFNGGKPFVDDLTVTSGCFTEISWYLVVVNSFFSCQLCLLLLRFLWAILPLRTKVHPASATAVRKACQLYTSEAFAHESLIPMHLCALLPSQTLA